MGFDSKSHTHNSPAKTNYTKCNTKWSTKWNIKDANGHVEDIYGPGVVGKQPKILPNEYFEYVSFCPLKTPIGFMKGAFSMVNDKKVEFDVKIEPFRLFVPEIFN